MAKRRSYERDVVWNTNIKIVIGLLALTCLGLLVTVVILAVDKSTGSPNAYSVCLPSSALRSAIYSTSNGLFRDLSKEEITRVRDYVLNDASLNVTEFSKATVASNYIHLIELWNPDKDEAIAYLDGRSKKKPTRQARVVIFAGARSPPIVQEILVPVDDPKSHVFVHPGRNNPIPFDQRPSDSLEITQITNIVDNFTRTVKAIMSENFQMDCTTSCAAWIPSIPFKQGDRATWVRLHRQVTGITVYPLPVELLLALNGNDVSEWGVEKVFYNNVVFDSIESFINAYKSRKIAKVFQPAPDMDNLYSSFKRRGYVKPTSQKVEPRMYEPGGKRYTTENNHIEFMGWSFDFRMRTSSGPQLFDIRFNNTRIVYEMSLQEMVAFYGGFSPVPMFADYLDSAWALAKTFELVKGVDCPDTASYFDVVAFVDSGKVTRRKNAVCVFELNTGMPLRRHFEFDGEDKYVFYGGMPSTALVFRTIITPYNYDYIFDYIFYQNGVIEAKVVTTGYILSSYWSSEEGRFSGRVRKDVAGSIHDHLFHFKVDLDIAGRENSFEIIRSKVNKSTRWSPDGQFRYEKYFEREHKKTEKAAAYKYDFQRPSYLNFYNEDAKNAQGVRRGYRVQLNGIINQMYPSNWSYTKAISWSYNQLAVTKYKKNETRSSSIYNQMDFFDPMVDFGEFIEDNDDISKEDLVTWITVGVMHLPHSEDIPTTATAGNSAGFFLRPYNYFEEDPSVASRDSVLITPSGKGSKVVRPERDARLSCVPRNEPISFVGNLEL